MARNYNGNAIKEQKRNYQLMIRQGQLECDHKDAKGPTLDSLSDSKDFIRNRHMYGPAAVICKQCKEIFEFETYTRAEVQNALTCLRSISNQIKVLDDLSDEDYDKNKAILEFLDEYEASILPYYDKIVKQIGNKDAGRKGNNTRQKGRLGISSSQFASR